VFSLKTGLSGQLCFHRDPRKNYLTHCSSERLGEKDTTSYLFVCLGSVGVASDFVVSETISLLIFS
jgi:hypothetical protein